MIKHLNDVQIAFRSYQSLCPLSSTIYWVILKAEKLINKIILRRLSAAGIKLI